MTPRSKFPKYSISEHNPLGVARQATNTNCRHPDNLDGKLIRVVGENMLDVFCGKTTILEHMLKDDVLNRFYVEALGFPQFNQCLSRTIGQIYHRYPDINILEIGESALILM